MIDSEDNKKISEFISSKRLTNAIHELEDNQFMRSTTLDLDNDEFSRSEHLTKKLLNTLNSNFLEYDFSIEPWHNVGFDLVITNIQRQKEYELLPKTKTMKDVVDEIEKSGVKTDILLHCDANKRITEQEYKEFVAFYNEISKGILND